MPIRIQYIPPQAQLPAVEATPPPGGAPQEALAPPVWGSLLEGLQRLKAPPSRLALGEVGALASSHRLRKDQEGLAQAWRRLGQLVGGPQAPWESLAQAAQASDPEVRPDALAQARRELELWWRRAPDPERVPPAVRGAVQDLEAWLERLERRQPGPAPTKALGLAMAPGQEPPWWRRWWPPLGSPPPRPAALLMERGQEHWRLGQLAAARGALEEAAGLAPGHPQVLLTWARFLAEEGQAEEAIAALAEAEAWAPGPAQAQALALLGDLAHQAHRPLEALRWYERALHSWSRHPDLQARLGVTRYELGQRSQAVGPLEEALRMDSRCLVARYYLAQVALQENDLLRARYQLGLVAKLSPELDLARFGHEEQAAIAAWSADRAEQRHHWKLPRRAPTGQLSPPGQTGGLPES